MGIDKATVSRLLKKPKAYAERANNLWAQVGSGKKKAIHFYFYWTDFGKRQYRKIGRADGDSSAAFLKQLNAQYLSMYSDFQRGITPRNLELLDERRNTQERAVRERLVSVEEIFHQYLENHLGATGSHQQKRADENRYKKYIHPAIGQKAAAHISKKQMQGIVDEVTKKAGPAQGYYYGEYLKRVWTYASDTGHDNLDMKAVARLRRPPKPRRQRVASSAEMKAILRDGDPLIQAMLYTGQRVGDVRQMRWSEIEDDWLTIPPERYKTKRHHRVYLTKTVQRLMNQASRKSSSDEFVWAGYKGKCVGETTAHYLFQEIDLSKVSPRHEPSLTMRDFRRTCYTFIQQHFGMDVAAAVAGHAQAGMAVVYGQYAYDEKKIEAMLAWEKHLNELKRG